MESCDVVACLHVGHLKVWYFSNGEEQILEHRQSASHFPPITGRLRLPKPEVLVAPL